MKLRDRRGRRQRSFLSGSRRRGRRHDQIRINFTYLKDLKRSPKFLKPSTTTKVNEK